MEFCSSSTADNWHNGDGMKKRELETPALVMDLDAMEHNLATMAEFSRKAQVNLRPHFKNHGILALETGKLRPARSGLRSRE